MFNHFFIFFFVNYLIILCKLLESLCIEEITMSTIKVNIADATIADIQTKLGLNRSVAKVITEQKPCNM